MALHGESRLFPMGMKMKAWRILAITEWNSENIVLAEPLLLARIHTFITVRRSYDFGASGKIVFSLQSKTNPKMSFCTSHIAPSATLDLPLHCHWGWKYRESLSWPKMQHGPIAPGTLGQIVKCSRLHTPRLDIIRCSCHLSSVRSHNPHPERHNLWTCDLTETKWASPRIVLQHLIHSHKQHRSR